MGDLWSLSGHVSCSATQAWVLGLPRGPLRLPLRRSLSCLFARESTGEAVGSASRGGSHAASGPRPVQLGAQSWARRSPAGHPGRGGRPSARSGEAGTSPLFPAGCFPVPGPRRRPWEQRWDRCERQGSGRIEVGDGPARELPTFWRWGFWNPWCWVRTGPLYGVFSWPDCWFLPDTLA